MRNVISRVYLRRAKRLPFHTLAFLTRRIGIRRVARARGSIYDAHYNRFAGGSRIRSLYTAPFISSDRANRAQFLARN